MNRVDQDSFAIESNKKAASFDFDAWQQLAQSDPDEFEQKRRMLLDGLVEKMHCRDDSLMQMRAHIDQQRSKRSLQDDLPRLMLDLAKSFKQLNADFASRTKRWPN